MKKLGYILGLIVLSIVLLPACGKRKLDSQISADQSTMAAENAWGAVFVSVAKEYTEIEEEQLKNSNWFFEADDSCAEVSFILSQAGDYVEAISLNYDPACLRSDGSSWSGIITISSNGTISNQGTKINISLTDFYIDNIKLEGEQEINIESALRKTVSVTGKVIFADGSIVERNSQKEFTWVSGFLTADICDDVWEITGASNGKDRNGDEYTLQIVDPLVKEGCCPWISKGRLSIEKPNGVPREINFGVGTCDNDAVLTWGRRSYDIKL